MSFCIGRIHIGKLMSLQMGAIPHSEKIYIFLQNIWYKTLKWWALLMHHTLLSSPIHAFTTNDMFVFDWTVIYFETDLKYTKPKKKNLGYLCKYSKVTFFSLHIDNKCNECIELKANVWTSGTILRTTLVTEGKMMVVLCFKITISIIVILNCI